jgi:hypothetical protein
VTTTTPGGVKPGGLSTGVSPASVGAVCVATGGAVAVVATGEEATGAAGVVDAGGAAPVTAFAMSGVVTDGARSRRLVLSAAGGGTEAEDVDATDFVDGMETPFVECG